LPNYFSEQTNDAKQASLETLAGAGSWDRVARRSVVAPVTVELSAVNNGRGE